LGHFRFFHLYIKQHSHVFEINLPYVSTEDLGLEWNKKKNSSNSC